MASSSSDTDGSSLETIRALTGDLYWTQRLTMKSQLIFFLLSPQEQGLLIEHFPSLEPSLQKGKLDQALQRWLQALNQQPMEAFASLGLMGDLQEFFAQGRSAGSIQNAFIKACLWDYLDIARLLESRASFITPFTLNNAFEKVAAEGHLEVLGYLRSIGAIKFDYALYQACRGGHVEAARLLVSWGASNFNRALKGAAASGNLELCRWLLELSVNQTGSALIKAAAAGHLEVVRLLLAQPRSYLGVDPIGSIKAATFQAANLLVLKELLMYMPVDNYQQMMDNAIEKNQLSMVATPGCPQGKPRFPMVEFLLQYHSPLSSQPFHYNYQKMALLATTDTTSLELLAFVLKLGPVDLDVVLREAAIYHRLDMVQYLLQQGARDVDGALETLCEADSFGRPGLELARFLVEEAGATNLNPALVAAARHGRLQAVRYLVSRGASAVNEALVAAVSSSKGMPVIEYLLDQGANDINGAMWASLEFNGMESELLELFTRRGLLSPDYRELDEQLLIAFRDG